MTSQEGHPAYIATPDPSLVGSVPGVGKKCGLERRMSETQNSPHSLVEEVARTCEVTSSDAGSSTRKGSDSSINGMSGMHTLISGDDSFVSLHAFSTKSLRIASKGEKDKKSAVSQYDQPALIAKSISQRNRPSATGWIGAELLEADGISSYEEGRTRAQTSWVPSGGLGDGTPAPTTIIEPESSGPLPWLGLDPGVLEGYNNGRRDFRSTEALTGLGLDPGISQAFIASAWFSGSSGPLSWLSLDPGIYYLSLFPGISQAFIASAWLSGSSGPLSWLSLDPGIYYLSL